MAERVSRSSVPRRRLVVARLEAVGGTLEIDSRVGRGTTLTARMPATA